jgi:Asp-tRNA(Asn)/Glu-tRNA(Gln) amidotransferase C subunit
MTATKTRRFAIGAGFEGSLEAVKSVVNDRERTTLEQVIAPFIGGTFNVLLTKPYAEGVTEAIKSTEAIVKQTTGMTDAEIKKVEKLMIKDTDEAKIEASEIVKRAKLRKDSELSSIKDKTVSSEDMKVLDGNTEDTIKDIKARQDELYSSEIAPVIKDKDIIGDALSKLEYMKKMKSLTVDAYEKLRFDLGFGLQTSASQTSRDFFTDFFSDPMLYKVHIDRVYGGDIQESMSKNLGSVVDAELGGLRKEINEVLRNEDSFIKFNPRLKFEFKGVCSEKTLVFGAPSNPAHCDLCMP